MFECKLIIKSAQLAQVDLLRLVLVKLGMKEQDIVEKLQKGKTCLSFFVKPRKKALTVFAKIRALKLKGFALRIRSLKDADWKTRWKKYVRPFAITRQIRVVPLWRVRQNTKKSDKDIYIDTTLAFGTGLHATTRMMARLIALEKGKFSRFLDVGTGSGILSVIAHRYGARRLYAIDIDKDAVKTARRNLIINHCLPARVKVLSFDNFYTNKQLDFIAANLLTEDLIRLKNKLIACLSPGKYLAVSGIYRDNYAGFRKRFNDRRLKCSRVITQKGWYALLFTRGNYKNPQSKPELSRGK